MRVDVLYFDGCPHHSPTVDLVRDVVRSLGVTAIVREVVVRDVDEASRLRFLGSPTVQVNGRDVDPAARERADYSFCCRMYGRSGSPPRALLERALQDEVSKQSRGDST